MSFLMKPDPFSSEVSRLFNTMFAPGDARSQRWMPAMDLVEEGDHFVLKADLPGLSEEDVSIEIEDNVLTISGERHEETRRDQRQGWHRVERTFGRFSRSLSLPEGIDPENVAASFSNGVLSITVPKPEQRRPRKVQIHAGGGQAAVEGTARETGNEASNGAPASEAESTTT